MNKEYDSSQDIVNLYHNLEELTEKIHLLILNSGARLEEYPSAIKMTYHLRKCVETQNTPATSCSNLHEFSHQCLNLAYQLQQNHERPEIVTMANNLTDKSQMLLYKLTYGE